MVLRDQEGTERRDVVRIQRNGDVEILRKLRDTAVFHFVNFALCKKEKSKFASYVIVRSVSPGALQV